MTKDKQLYFKKILNYHKVLENNIFYKNNYKMKRINLSLATILLMFCISEITYGQQNKPYKQITSTTYEVPIEDIRAANQIFAEHKNYEETFAEMTNAFKKLQEKNELIEKDKNSLLQNIADYKSILTEKDNIILSNDTYFNTKIKTVKRQRNIAIMSTILVVAGTIILAN